MTERQEEILRTYQEIGSIRGTAKELGVHRSTVDEVVKKFDGQLPEKDDKVKRIKQLEKLVEQQQERIDRLHAKDFKLPDFGKVKHNVTDSYCRVILGDLHGYHMDESAVTAVVSDIAKIVPREVVWLGDVVDCGGFLAQHHVMGFVAETAYTFEADVAAANAVMDAVAKAAPGATEHFLEGNHEHRIERWLCTQTLRNAADAEYLRKMFGIEHVLHIKERGVNYYRQGVHYQGLAIPATIKLGHCYFTHGSSTAKHAAKAHLDQFAGNIVYGHSHRADMASSRTVSDGLICAWNPGCLCKLQPLWMHTSITGWSHGFAVQLVQPDGSFLHINVPVINGRSYLMDLLDGATHTARKKGSRRKNTKVARQSDRQTSVRGLEDILAHRSLSRRGGVRRVQAAREL